MTHKPSKELTASLLSKVIDAYRDQPRGSLYEHMGKKWPQYAAVALATLASQSIASADIIDGSSLTASATSNNQRTATSAHLIKLLANHFSSVTANTSNIGGNVTFKTIAGNTPHTWFGTGQSSVAHGARHGKSSFLFILATANNTQSHDNAWVKLSYVIGPAATIITESAWAYDNTGGTITFGETSSPVPEPASIGLTLLAAGAAGVLALRKRRQSAQ